MFTFFWPQQADLDRFDDKLPAKRSIPGILHAYAYRLKPRIPWADTTGGQAPCEPCRNWPAQGDIIAWQFGSRDVYLNPTCIHSNRLTIMQPAFSPFHYFAGLDVHVTPLWPVRTTKGSIVSVPPHQSKPIYSTIGT